MNKENFAVENEQNFWVLEDAVEIEPLNEDQFLTVCETLTRIGIPSWETKKLFQTAHLLHKRGRYFIIHFKGLFALDGKESKFDEVDWFRQNNIAELLHSWGLITPKTNIITDNGRTKVKVIRHSDKDKWELVPKYNLGKVRKKYSVNSEG